MNNINSADTKISKFTPFAERLLHWYSRTAREMPWRIPPRDHAMGVRAEPYHVWLSEIMLQQTQVATVKDYFLKFIGLWPTVYDLSQAEEDEILTAWAGLGYYSRARNLKKCADLIVSDHGGKFPDTFDALKTLPGIGDYTAAAIATIAFDQPIPVIDGNIERVITRHAYIETLLPKAKVEIRAHLETVLSQEKPGEFAQAMMDLGATLCTPKRPNCLLCPVQEDCIARQKGDMELFPVKPVKKQKPTRKGAAFIVEDGSGAIFLCKRPKTGLLAGMSQVPTNNWNVRCDDSTDTTNAPVKGDWKNLGIARHTFTHFHLELTVWHIKADPALIQQPGWWCSRDQLGEQALPTLMRKVLSKAIKLQIRHK